MGQTLSPVALSAKRLDFCWSSEHPGPFPAPELTAEAGWGRTLTEAWESFHSLLSVTAVCTASVSWLVKERMEDVLFLSSAISVVSFSQREGFLISVPMLQS